MYLTRSHSLCGCVCFWVSDLRCRQKLQWRINVWNIRNSGWRRCFYLYARIKWRIHAIPRSFRNKKARFLNTGRYFTHSRILGWWYCDLRVPGTPSSRTHAQTQENKKWISRVPGTSSPGHIHRHKKTKNEIWPVLSWLRAVFLSSVRKMDITMSSSWSAQNSFTRTPARFFISSTRLKFANFEQMNSVKYLTNTTFVALMKNAVTRTFDC